MQPNWEQRVTILCLTILSISLSIWCLVDGEDVSKAFTNLGAGLTIRVMGGFFLVGGLSLLWSFLRRDDYWRVLSCVFLGTGAAIYAVGVLLGLKNQGVVSGHLSAMLVCLFFIQVLGTLRLVKRVPDAD